MQLKGLLLDALALAILTVSLTLLLLVSVVLAILGQFKKKGTKS
jgi:hypothetical protein